MPKSYLDIGFTNTVEVEQEVQNTQNLCILGQTSKAGVTNGDLFENIKSLTQAGELFGKTSHIYSALRPVFNLFEDQTVTPNIHVMALTDPTGGGVSSSSATLTLSGGSATKGGSLLLYITDRTRPIEVKIKEQDTDTNTATAIKNAVDAVKSEYPVSVSVTGKVVTFTSNEKGLAMNDYYIDYDLGNVEGLNFALVKFTGGAGSTKITKALIDKLGQTEFNFVSHRDYGLDIFKAYLDGQATPSKYRSIKTGRLFVAIGNTDVTTTKGIATSNKSNYISLIYTDNTSKDRPFGYSVYQIGVIVACIYYLRLTPGANISTFMSNDVYDVGSPSLYNVPTAHTLYPAFSKKFSANNSLSSSDLTNLEDVGVASFRNSSIFPNLIESSEIFTTSSLDGYKYANVVDTMDYIEKSLYTTLYRSLTQSRNSNSPDGVIGTVDKTRLLATLLNYVEARISEGVLNDSDTYKKRVTDVFNKTYQKKTSTDGVVLSVDFVSEILSSISQINFNIKTKLV